MRTTRELNGLAVVDVRDGKKLGSIDEVVISPEDGRLLGFVMGRGGLLGGPQLIVEAEDIRSIGQDAITVEGDEVAHTPDAAAERFRQARGGDRHLVGRKVVTRDGNLVGEVSDVAINVDTRRVTALLVGGGMLERADAVAADRIVSVGPDVVVVREAGAVDQDPGPFEGDRESRRERDIRPYPAAVPGRDDAPTTEEPSGRDPV